MVDFLCYSRKIYVINRQIIENKKVEELGMALLLLKLIIFQTLPMF